MLLIFVTYFSNELCPTGQKGYDARRKLTRHNEFIFFRQYKFKGVSRKFLQNSFHIPNISQNFLISNNFEICIQSEDIRIEVYIDS